MGVENTQVVDKASFASRPTFSFLCICLWFRNQEYVVKLIQQKFPDKFQKLSLPGNFTPTPLAYLIQPWYKKSVLEEHFAKRKASLITSVSSVNILRPSLCYYTMFPQASNVTDDM